MGYTSGHAPMFFSDMQQTPKTVAMVLDFAGWTDFEAAEATGINSLSICSARIGGTALIHEDWKKLLDVAGRRAFDWEDEQA